MNESSRKIIAMKMIDSIKI